MITPSFRWLRQLAWVLILGALVTQAAPVRADNLDIALVNKAGLVLDKLEDLKCKNVGVLHFRVKKGSQWPSFTLAPLCDNLSTRLENALVIRNNPAHPIGVIQDASSNARTHKVGGWSHSEKERKKLFDIDGYRLAWGTSRVKGDVFLTGLVTASDDLKKATVLIESFTAGHLKPAKVLEFEVAADRSLLADLGQTFAVASRGVSRADRDAHAIADARRRDLKKREAGDPSMTPDDVRGFKIEILYDGIAQPISPDNNSPGEWRVQPPRAGQKVSFALTQNGKTADTLAAVLKINGRSSWQQQDQESKMCQMWLHGPNERQVYEGFYQEVDGNNLIPFEVLDEKQSQEREAEFGSKVGLIELDVFESGPGGGGETMAISLRSLTRRDLRKTPVKDVKDLQQRLMSRGRFHWKDAKAASAYSRGEGLIVASQVEPVPAGKIDIRTFPNPSQVGHFVIRYYDPSRMSISK